MSSSSYSYSQLYYPQHHHPRHLHHHHHLQQQQQQSHQQDKSNIESLSPFQQTLRQIDEEFYTIFPQARPPANPWQISQVSQPHIGGTYRYYEDGVLVQVETDPSTSYSYPSPTLSSPTDVDYQSLYPSNAYAGITTSSYTTSTSYCDSHSGQALTTVQYDNSVITTKVQTQAEDQPPYQTLVTPSQPRTVSYPETTTTASYVEPPMDSLLNSIPKSPPFGSAPSAHNPAPYDAYPSPRSPDYDSSSGTTTYSANSTPSQEYTTPPSVESATPQELQFVCSESSTAKVYRNSRTNRNNRQARSSSLVNATKTRRDPVPKRQSQSMRLKPPSSSRTGEKKPHLACVFCRGRKIACGQPLPGSNTCNQCERRSLVCEYPSGSRRGMRKKKPDGNVKNFTDRI